MIYTVVWRPVAEQRLAQLWVTGPDRQAIASAADLIDGALKRDPHNVGESRSGVTRVVFEGPVGVLFDIVDADRQVAVLDVWRVRQP